MECALATGLGKVAPGGCQEGAGRVPGGCEEGAGRVPGEVKRDQKETKMKPGGQGKGGAGEQKGCRGRPRGIKREHKWPREGAGRAPGWCQEGAIRLGGWPLGFSLEFALTTGLGKGGPGSTPGGA